MGEKKTAGRLSNALPGNVTRSFYSSGCGGCGIGGCGVCGCGVCDCGCSGCCCGFGGFVSVDGVFTETGVTLAEPDAASSAGLYFGALTYPCTKFLSTLFTTTCTGCPSFSMWIKIGSYTLTRFLLTWLSSIISCRSMLLC